MRYAQIAGGAAVVFLEGAPDDWPDLRDAGVLHSAGPEVRTGWLWDGATFQPPPVTPVSRVVSSLEFRRRFTPAERGAITKAASDGVRAGFTVLQEFMDDLSAAGEVNLDSRDLAEGIDLLVHFDLLPAGRVAVILA